MNFISYLLTAVQIMIDNLLYIVGYNRLQINFVKI